MKRPAEGEADTSKSGAGAGEAGRGEGGAAQIGFVRGDHSSSAVTNIPGLDRSVTVVPACEPVTLSCNVHENLVAGCRGDATVVDSWTWLCWPLATHPESQTTSPFVNA